MTPRIRPTLEDYKRAEDFRWLAEGGWNMIDSRVGGGWVVFAKDDVFNHAIHSTEPTLEDAVRVARELQGGQDG